MVQGQFLPEAWGFAMACHRLPHLVFYCNLTSFHRIQEIFWHKTFFFIEKRSAELNIFYIFGFGSRYPRNFSTYHLALCKHAWHKRAVVYTLLDLNQGLKNQCRSGTSYFYYTGPGYLLIQLYQAYHPVYLELWHGVYIPLTYEVSSGCI